MSQKLILKKQISIQAPIAKVWNGLIDPEIIKLYLYGTKTISDWKVGSPIVFTGFWEEKEYKDHGTILKFEKEKIFQYNYWSNFSGIPDVPENYSIITFELKSEGTSTLLTLTQENFPTQTSYEHSDTGWDHSLKILKEFLER
ncbi:SRPBCC family protein [Leptospira yasudae]|uniref:ATPase n=1 Tax=Leptospira yasudae TaxID=2202201 RepID=A0A6N4QI82_9LEPT|nr:SRPBCC family protein [Leptospira yasudae]TGL77199.1 ATPase [Leptospira yasudae]TGL80499.1 ATPase [Leptospira yasudae]TGL85926.1 ATPase [Leptospira yasudae]